MFQQIYSFPAAFWILAWPKFLHPNPSALIYRAFSQSQRHPQAARAGAGFENKVLLVDKPTAAHGAGWEVDTNTVCPLWQNCLFPRTFKVSWRAESFPGPFVFLVSDLLQVQPIAGISFFLFFILFYRCSSTVVSISPHQSPPTQPSPPPTLNPTPFWLCLCVLYTCSLMTLPPNHPDIPSHLPSVYCHLFLESDLHCSWMISSKAQCNPLTLIGASSPLTDEEVRCRKVRFPPRVTKLDSHRGLANFSTPAPHIFSQ